MFEFIDIYEFLFCTFSSIFNSKSLYKKRDFKQIPSMNNNEGLYNLGTTLIDDLYYSKGVRCLHLAAKRGHLKSQLKLAKMYSNGEIVKKIN